MKTLKQIIKELESEERRLLRRIAEGSPKKKNYEERLKDVRITLHFYKDGDSVIRDLHNTYDELVRLRYENAVLKGELPKGFMDNFRRKINKKKRRREHR